jgi:hypothetical protein
VLRFLLRERPPVKSRRNCNSSHLRKGSPELVYLR